MDVVIWEVDNDKSFRFLNKFLSYQNSYNSPKFIEKLSLSLRDRNRVK